jgi:hypothetical protein
MDKQEIINSLIELLKADLEVLTVSATAARDAAIHSESKAEDQYDTRGLEASYLAGAQSKRALELEETISLFRFLELKQFSPSDAISSTALVGLHDGMQEVWFFLLPKGGGLSVVSDSKKITVITPLSPAGSLLLGAKVGEEVELSVGGKTRDFTVTHLL